MSRPTYYQTKTSFEEAGIAWPGAQEARSRTGRTNFRAQCWRLFKSNSGGGRAHSSAPAGQANRAEIPLNRPPEDDRAGGRGKKTAQLRPLRVDGPGRLAGRRVAVRGTPRQCCTRASAAAGVSLYGLMLFSSSRRMWAWTRVMAVPPGRQAAGSRASSIVELRHAERNQIRHVCVFAAMAINTELRGATS